MSQPNIFISSTCYDLKQIRQDLSEFVSNQGHKPFISEHNSFPINPDNTTIENCIQNVGSADIFVLIIGNRYGYVSESGKSITNTEFLYAKEKGIPTYIFILKSITSILPVWKSNKEADFSHIVDNSMVFEFVEDLREKNKNWCFEFETAQEIITTLKIQFSYLFKESLELRKRFRNTQFPDFYNSLSPTALNFILKKDTSWEHFFFYQALKDELMKHESIKLDLKYKIYTICTKQINNKQELITWLGLSIETINFFVNSFNNLLSVPYKTYLGEDGAPSDLKGLYYVACGVGKLVKEMILWTIEMKSMLLDPKFSVICEAVSDMLLLNIEKTWEFPTKVMADMQKAILLKQTTGEIAKANATLKLDIDQNLMEVYKEEMQKIKLMD